MNKTTETIVNAFLKGESAILSNSRTDGKSYFLHENRIANKVDGGIEIRDCGYKTRTTSERLNGLPGVELRIKRGEWILNGEKWNGQTIKISSYEY